MASTGPSGAQGGRGMQYGGAQGGAPGVGAARPSHRGAAPGIYNFSIPVRPIRADISIDHLERLSSYYGLYGACKALVLWHQFFALVCILHLASCLPCSVISCLCSLITFSSNVTCHDGTV